jgi:hypothetical protein
MKDVLFHAPAVIGLEETEGRDARRQKAVEAWPA